MDLAIYQVDAFTTEPFKGNPAGVVITQQPLSETLMMALDLENIVISNYDNRNFVRNTSPKQQNL